MAYFPNGSAGMYFQGLWCDQCRHWKLRRPPGETKGEPETDGCPIWDAHILAEYSEHMQEVLGVLIADTDQGPQCLMFESGASATDEEWREYLDSMPMPPREET